MEKIEGQVSIFIIISLVIIFLIIGYFVIIDLNQKDLTNNLDEKTGVLVERISDCFDQVYLNSLMLAGFQGGYTNVEDGLFNGFVILPYYYEKGKLNIPTINTIESQIANYVDLTLDYCLNYNEPLFNSQQLNINITLFDLLEDNYDGYNIKNNNYKTEVKIDDFKIIFTTDLNLRISNKETETATIDFNKFPSEFPSDIFNMHLIASYITISLANNNQTICLTCVNDLAAEKNLEVQIFNYLNPDDELVIISNNISSVPFIYQYLNKYSQGS